MLEKIPKVHFVDLRLIKVESLMQTQSFPIVEMRGKQNLFITKAKKILLNFKKRREEYTVKVC